MLADERFVRAWPGGTGASKIGGYAFLAGPKLISLAITPLPFNRKEKQVKRSFYYFGLFERLDRHTQGFQQILWLYGPEHYVTEVGTMNLFFLWINENGCCSHLLH